MPRSSLKPGLTESGCFEAQYPAAAKRFWLQPRPLLPANPRPRLCVCLTFEVRRDRRRGARPGPQKMYTAPVARAWCPAVGPRLDRRVRPRPAAAEPEHGRPMFFPAAVASRSALKTMARHAFKPPRPLPVRRGTSAGLTEPTEDLGLPRSAMFRCGTAVPSHRCRNLRQRCSDHEPFCPCAFRSRRTVRLHRGE